MKDINALINHHVEQESIYDKERLNESLEVNNIIEVLNNLINNG